MSKFRFKSETTETHDIRVAVKAKHPNQEQIDAIKAALTDLRDITEKVNVAIAVCMTPAIIGLVRGIADTQRKMLVGLTARTESKNEN